MNRAGFPSFACLSLGFAVAVLAPGCTGPIDARAPSSPGSQGASKGAAAETAAGAQPAQSSSTQRMRGIYSHMADAGSFVDCHSGQRLLVATEADNAALEHAYLKARPAPGSPVLATVDGRIESRVFMEGPERPVLIVERFVEVRTDHNCSGPV